MTERHSQQEIMRETSQFFQKPLINTQRLLLGSNNFVSEAALLENGLDRPKNRYGRYGFPSFSSIFISTVGVDGARVCL